MKPIYEKLYNAYCEPILLTHETFDESQLKQQLAFLHLTQDNQRKLMDALLDLHDQCRWTVSPRACIWASLCAAIRYDNPR